MPHDYNITPVSSGIFLKIGQDHFLISASHAIVISIVTTGISIYFAIQPTTINHTQMNPIYEKLDSFKASVEGKRILKR